MYLKKQFRFQFENLQIKRHVVPLVISLLLVNVELLYTQLDKIMLSPFVNDIAVTEYTVPTMLVTMVASIPLAFVSVSIPRLSSYVGTQDTEAYQETLKDTMRTYMSILIPIALGLFVLSEEVMWLYTKDVYTYAYPVLALAALARIVYGYESIILNLMMYVWGFEKKMTLYLFLGGILNVVSNFVLAYINCFSAFTALLTNVIACLLVIVVCKRYFDKSVPVRIRFFDKYILRYLLVSALFIPIAILIKGFEFGYWFNIIVTMAVCIILYVIFLLLAKDPLLRNIKEILKRG